MKGWEESLRRQPRPVRNKVEGLVRQLASMRTLSLDHLECLRGRPLHRLDALPLPETVHKSDMAEGELDELCILRWTLVIWER